MSSPILSPTSPTSVASSPRSRSDRMDVDEDGKMTEEERRAELEGEDLDEKMHE